jgi:carbon-monoxide dehydrogenase large subunit
MSGPAISSALHCLRITVEDRETDSRRSRPRHRAALYEEVIYDADGQLLTASLADYAIPTASETPSIVTVHLEAEAPSTVGGFRGMGEGGTIGAPPAIANALADALAPLGAEIFELPMTPEPLFRLIEKVKARAQGESRWI